MNYNDDHGALGRVLPTVCHDLKAINWTIEKHMDAKHRINNLLWSVLPGRTTLDEADALSNAILELIEKQCQINIVG